MSRRVVVLDSQVYENLVSSEPPPDPPDPPPSNPEPWLQGIPLRFQSSARKTKENLEKFFKIVENTLVMDDQVLDLATVLRALCVPFTRAKLPQNLKRLLIKYKIKCRNHLALKPEWRPYFHF